MLQALIGLYERDCCHCFRTVEHSMEFRAVRGYVLNHDLNRTKLFRGAPFAVKAINVLKRHVVLKRKSADRLNDYIQRYVMNMLGGDVAAQIGFLNRTCWKPVQVLKRKYPELAKKIIDMTKNLDGRYGLTTRCFWIMREISGFDDSRYTCHAEGCPKSVLKGWNANSLDSEPNQYCCAKCRANDAMYKEKLKQSMLWKYGVENAMQAESVKEKARVTSTRRYGVAYAAQNAKILEKALEAKRRKYGNGCGDMAKLRRHFTPELRRKIANTSREKFGVEFPLQNPVIHGKTVESRPKPDGKRHGATTSKEEQKIYSMLRGVFGDGNVLTHYRSEKYPFYCDFYLKQTDMYVEYNGYWMHGGHAFDPESAEDVNTLGRWKEKAAQSKSYAKAVETWAVRDPLKLKTATENRLNYVVLYTMGDAYEWMEKTRK